MAHHNNTPKSVLEAPVPRSVPVAADQINYPSERRRRVLERRAARKAKGR